MAIQALHVYSNKKHAVGSVGPVFVFFSRCPPEVATVRWFARHFRQHRQNYSNGFGFLFYAEPDAGSRPALDGDARREFIEAVRAGPEGKGALSVFTQAGFLGATFRALVSGLTLALRSPVPTKVTSSLADGLPWFIDTLALGKLTVTATEIENGVAVLSAATD